MHAHNFQKYIVTQDLLEDEGKRWRAPVTKLDVTYR